LGRDILPSKPSTGSIHIAEAYINGLILEIPPRKRWPSTDYTGKINIPIPNNIGLCLAKYGDPGYGELVKRDKYSPKKRFCDELVGKSAKVLRPLVNEKEIKYITCVPSLRSDIVLDFSKRLAESLGLTFVELLKKSNTRQQKEMQNSSYQCGNAMHSFSLLDGVEVPDKVLLVDDVVDSRWTLTACGYYLSQGGCGEIYPFALADSSQKED
jgi:ATP-dependent DNA helicase RecQ